MGVVISADCEKCSYTKKLFIGGGLADCNEDAIYRLLPKDGKAKLRESIENGASGISVNRRICVCTKCGNIYAGAEVKCKIGATQITIVDDCPSCGSRQKTYPTTDGSYIVRCPKCGKNISFSETGHWD